MRVVRWALIVLGVLVGLSGLAMFAWIAFVFSIGTRTGTLLIEASVYDRNTKAPVPGCLLAFEKGTLFMTSGEGQTSERTNAEGRSLQQKPFMDTGSLLLEPFVRDRHRALRFYVGQAPAYGTFTQAEAWDVEIDFREPLRKPADVVPEVKVQRVLAHEDMTKPPPGKRWQMAGWRPLPAGWPESRLESAVSVREDGTTVRLSVHLDPRQVAACQAPTREEMQRHALRLYNDGRYEEALAAYRAAAPVIADEAWAHNGAGNSLINLKRQKEAIEEHRRAVELAPRKADIQYGYANSLIGLRDQDAVAEFQKLIVLEPQAARGHIGLASALCNLERWRGVLDALEKAEQLCASCLDAEDRQLLREARRKARR